MKYLICSILTVVLIASCKKDAVLISSSKKESVVKIDTANNIKNPNAIVIQKKRFEHKMGNCDLFNNNPELYCGEWIEFNNDSLATALIGGGDIMTSLVCKVVGDTTMLKNKENNKHELTFVYIHIDTLQRIPGLDKWARLSE